MSKLVDERYDIIKEIAEKNNEKKKLKEKEVKAAVALKQKRKRRMTDKEVENLAAFVNFNSDTHISFDGTNDANEITEEVSIMDAYEESRDE
jgi:hypothetical protein